MNSKVGGKRPVAVDQTSAPSYSPWRHGGWYVHSNRYPDGTVGCVSNNYPDGKWRIVEDPRREGELGGPGDYSFVTRDEAARAEHALVLGEFAKLPTWISDIEDSQLRYAAASLVKDLQHGQGRSIGAIVEAAVRIRGVDGEALKRIGERFVAEQRKFSQAMPFENRAAKVEREVGSDVKALAGDGVEYLDEQTAATPGVQR
jgi:hypothetical protein